MITELIGMSDFVLGEYEINKLNSDTNFFNSIINYAKFLKQPITKGMFVPASIDGNVLSYPDKDYYRSTYDCAFHSYKWQEHYWKDIELYNTAFSNVLFEGFKLCDRGDKNCVNNLSLHLLDSILKGRTVEYLCQFNLKLTKKAQNLIYGNN